MYEALSYPPLRWYRAPELIMLAKDYTSAIDMWRYAAASVFVLLYH